VTGYEEKLKILHCDALLWNRIKIFIYDLLRFGNPELARNRLERAQCGPFMFSLPYFDEKQAQILLSFHTHEGLSVRDVLSVLMQKKFKSGPVILDFAHLCTSHDMAPSLQTVFGIRKGFDSEKNFRLALKEFDKVKEWKRAV
jgi:hypothetical protein